jgi:hypothetical protein
VLVARVPFRELIRPPYKQLLATDNEEPEDVR